MSHITKWNLFQYQEIEIEFHEKVNVALRKTGIQKNNLNSLLTVCKRFLQKYFCFYCNNCQKGNIHGKSTHFQVIIPCCLRNEPIMTIHKMPLMILAVVVVSQGRQMESAHWSIVNSESTLTTLHHDKHSYHSLFPSCLPSHIRAKSQ